MLSLSDPRACMQYGKFAFAKMNLDLIAFVSEVIDIISNLKLRTLSCLFYDITILMQVMSMLILKLKYIDIILLYKRNIVKT